MFPSGKVIADSHSCDFFLKEMRFFATAWRKLGVFGPIKRAKLLMQQ
tara:strand:+ start:143 stop:283 length:141 start_codon:yes stop_codon:yes gene_type:complete